MAQKEGVTPVFDTLAILDQDEKAGAGRVSVPSPKAVRDAKDWVDHNEK